MAWNGDTASSGARSLKPGSHLKYTDHVIKYSAQSKRVLGEVMLSSVHPPLTLTS